MGNLGMQEILVILVIALLVIGPKKLPELAKALGRAIAEFRRATEDLKKDLDVENLLKDDEVKKGKSARDLESLQDTVDSRKKGDAAEEKKDGEGNKELNG